MAVSRKAKLVRRSISLSSETNRKIQQLAGHQRVSANRVLEDLVEAGLEVKQAEKRHFFELAERLRTTQDATELRRIKDELARMTFGT